MDTRAKIMSAQDARARVGDRPAQWVSGHFDPLLAEHIRWLRERRVEGELLVLEITDSERPLLEQRARAELAAALAMVDYVVFDDGGAKAAGDATITEQFIERVQRRNRSEGPR